MAIMHPHNLMPMETKALSLKHFDWLKETKELVAEESQLRDGRRFDGTHPWMQQVWNDSCDIGIAIRSHTTNKIERFYLDKEDRDSEGEVGGWHFKPVDTNCPVRHVLIIND